MAWNEPGSGKDKDPWGQNNNQGPPDLDEVFKNIQNKFGGLFGGSGNSGSSNGKGSSIGVALIAVVLLLVWGASGFYIVGPAERGIVLQFGAYKEVTKPGLHWHIPAPIEQYSLVNVDEFSSFRHSAQMLTKDENIVDVELTVQSKVQDAADYLFQDQSPQDTIRNAIETAVREVIGFSNLDFILTEGRSKIAADIKESAQKLIDHYRTGLVITSINMQPAKPPEQVKAAFDDAIKAREDKERLENEAEAYANEVVPKARGNAARQIADAKAYRDQVIAKAEGETSRFKSILKEYTAAPEVTRERLYIETIEEVFANNSKVILDSKGNGNLTLLPLDKLLGQSSTAHSTGVGQMSSSLPTTAQSRANARDRQNNSTRDVNRNRVRVTR